MNNVFKNNGLTISITAFLVVMSSQSAMSRPSHHGGSHGQPVAGSILNRMDFDNNGEVTLEDFVSRSINYADRHFSLIDKDADELISVEEYMNKRSFRGHKKQDFNFDQAALKQCIEEITGLSFKQHLGLEETFILIDADDSELVTTDEFMDYKIAQATKRFIELDSDENGVISELEITTSMTERKILHEARKNCFDEQLLMDTEGNNDV